MSEQSVPKNERQSSKLETRITSRLPSIFLVLGICATLMLVYASLVPLNYVPLSPKETYLRWKKIPWNDISLYSRSDWIANALVVIPSAFFLAGAVDCGRRSRWFLIFASPLILLFLAAIVLGIELVQVWFPPRTVSQNDIFAGWCGAVIGVATWFVFGRSMVWSLEKFVDLASPQDRFRWVAGALCIASLLYTVYPFDFVVSRAEFLEKYNLGRLRFDVDGSSMLRLETLKALVVAAVKVFPFGIFWGLAGKGQKIFFSLSFLAVIAIALELIQIPIYTKYASTAEAIAGIVGGWAGWCIARSQRLWWRWMDRSWVWVVAWLSWSTLLILAFNLRYDTVLTSGEAPQERWKSFFVPPLLRYYYTSEYSAFSNLAGKIGMFAILGVFWGLAGWTKSGRCSSARFWFGLVWAIMLGMVIEVMQVYLPPMIADASDVGIYGVGYVFGYVAIALVFGESGKRTTNSTNNTNKNLELNNL